MALTADEQSRLTNAINLMLKGTAVELPFDANVIDAVAKVAASSGFEPTNGAFKEDAKNNPISTLLRWVLYQGTH
jgi:hypothetical protein